MPQSDGYYQIQAAIIQAAATLAASMPAPTSAQLRETVAHDEKGKLMEVYQERFQMAHKAITDVVMAVMEHFPEPPSDLEDEDGEIYGYYKDKAEGLKDEDD